MDALPYLAAPDLRENRELGVRCGVRGIVACAADRFRVAHRAHPSGKSQPIQYAWRLRWMSTGGRWECQRSVWLFVGEYGGAGQGSYAGHWSEGMGRACQE